MEIKNYSAKLEVWGQIGDIQAQDDHLLGASGPIFIIGPLCDLACLDNENICGISLNLTSTSMSQYTTT